MPDYSGLLPYCRSDLQRKLIAALSSHGSKEQAYKDVGKDRRWCQRTLKDVEASAALSGYAPTHNWKHTVPHTHIAKGVSTLYNAEGEVSAQWVKADLRLSAVMEAMHAAFEGLRDEVRGLAKVSKPPAICHADSLTVYPLGDPHIGLYAWHAECGEDFDTSIARNDLLSAATKLVAVSPPSEQALIANLGDYFHADGVANLTTAGTRQDVDTRWPRVLRVGFLLMVDLITLALKKHQHVEVINAIGNHDEHTSMALSGMLGAWFHNEPRVTIRETVRQFEYVEFGKVLIGVTHGNRVKPLELDSLMAADMPDAWGRTEHRYWYTGHIHHTSKRELRGCVQESFRTLAAKDSWHTAQGYRSGRDMYAIVHHREYGEVERYRCDIRMARDGRNQVD